MTLLKACEIAQACTLTTVGEAVHHIMLHAINILDYDKITEELEELIKEAQTYPENTPIAKILKDAVNMQPKKIVDGLYSLVSDRIAFFHPDPREYDDDAWLREDLDSLFGAIKYIEVHEQFNKQTFHKSEV